MTFVKCSECESVLFGYKPARLLRCGECGHKKMNRMSPPEINPETFRVQVKSVLYNWMDHGAYKDSPLECENCGDIGTWDSHYMEMVSGYDRDVCSVDCLMGLIGEE